LFLILGEALNRKERRKTGHRGSHKTIEDNQYAIHTSFLDAQKWGSGFLMINAKGQMERIDPQEIFNESQKNAIPSSS